MSGGRETWAISGAGRVAPGTGGVAPGTGGVAPGAGRVAPGTDQVAPAHAGARPATGARLVRYRLRVAYDGTAYRGFQQQAPGFDTVAGRLEAALAEITPEGREGERVVVEGASRTDAGVHALDQVCAFSSRLTVPLDRLPLAMNAHLPRDISVLTADRVAADFDPRRATREKTYLYRIWRSRVASPFWRNWALHVPGRLDFRAMREALAALPGCHDFAAFRDEGSSAKTTVRTIYRAELSGPVWVLGPAAPSGRPADPAQGKEAGPPNEGLATISVTGDGFLYHMVRVIVGTLLEVGLGRLQPDTFRQALARPEIGRSALGPTAPAHGLWLASIKCRGENDQEPAKP